MKKPIAHSLSAHINWNVKIKKKKKKKKKKKEKKKKKKENLVWLEAFQRFTLLSISRIDIQLHSKTEGVMRSIINKSYK